MLFVFRVILNAPNQARSRLFESPLNPPPSNRLSGGVSVIPRQLDLLVIAAPPSLIAVAFATAGTNLRALPAPPEPPPMTSDIPTFNVLLYFDRLDHLCIPIRIASHLVATRLIRLWPVSMTDRQ